MPFTPAEWEGAGRVVATRDGDVFVLDLPATDEVGLAPLLVLHGFPTCSLDWGHVVGALAARRRVVLFDFLGFGLSSKPDRRYGIRLHADTAEAVVAATGIEEVALVSHDMGDTVGGELLARDLEGSLPFGVSERVLTNGSIYIEMAQLTAGQQMLLGLDDAPVDLAAAGIDPAAGFKGGVALTFSPGHPASEEDMSAQWDMVSRLDGHTLLPRTIRYIEDRRAEEERFTGAIETHPSPLGVVWGDLDPVAVYPMAERLVAARPGTPLVTLDGVGHYPMVEDPVRFADAVLRLLS
ncbi:MAG: hypothetical protein QOJ67_1927 [Acidimicrobiaceae bacterium]|jgi:pimeloyl-ACP methyl ester carboxylesterase